MYHKEYNQFKSEYDEIKGILNDCFGTNNKITKFQIGYLIKHLENAGINKNDFENKLQESCIYFDGIPKLNDIIKLFPTEKKTGCQSCENGWIEKKFSAYPCPKCNKESYNEIRNYKISLYNTLGIKTKDAYNSEVEGLKKQEDLNKKFYEKTEHKNNIMTEKYKNKELYQDNILD